MSTEEEEFFDEAFESSGSNRSEFEDMYQDYMQNMKGGGAMDQLGQMFGGKLKLYLELIAIQNAFSEWESKYLKPSSMERIPDELAEMITGEKNSGTYAYKLKSGATSKITLN